MIFFRKNDYQIIKYPDKAVLKKEFSGVWKDGSFPIKQWNRVKKQLENINDVSEFRAIIASVRATNLKNPSILEVGCSSGYLGEVLQRSKIKVRYEGTDYSPSFISFAKEKYPKIKFTVNDATKLKYDSASFDIVISGCCILHIVDYQKAISEASRVAKKYVIFHRTPIFHIQPTAFFTKTAYDAEMLEIIFNEEELVDLFFKNKLAIIKIFTVGQSDENMVMKNYVCKKLA